MQSFRKRRAGLSATAGLSCLALGYKFTLVSYTWFQRTTYRKLYITSPMATWLWVMTSREPKKVKVMTPKSYKKLIHIDLKVETNLKPTGVPTVRPQSLGRSSGGSRTRLKARQISFYKAAGGDTKKTSASGFITSKCLDQPLATNYSMLIKIVGKCNSCRAVRSWLKVATVSVRPPGCWRQASQPVRRHQSFTLQ